MSLHLAQINFIFIYWANFSILLLFWGWGHQSSNFTYLYISLCCFLFIVAKLCPTLFAIPWTTACKAPLSVGFPREEYWSGLPFPSPEDLPDRGIEPMSPVWQVDSLPLNHLRSLTFHFGHPHIDGYNSYNLCH